MRIKKNNERHLKAPNSACSVNAGGAKKVGIDFIPVK